MGVWIRSQNKKTLVVCSAFHSNSDNQIVGFDNSNANEDLFDYLGSYSTKEKALKVLDMIQKHIEDNIYNNVFQMPQDDEI